MRVSAGSAADTCETQKISGTMLKAAECLDKNAPVDEWAAEFDSWVALQVEKRQIEKLYDYRRSAPHGRLSVPAELPGKGLRG